MQNLFRHLLPAALALALTVPLGASAGQAADNDQVLSRMNLGGDGGWDYLSVRRAAPSSVCQPW
jgi:hypothetical protein